MTVSNDFALSTEHRKGEGKAGDEKERGSEGDAGVNRGRGVEKHYSFKTYLLQSQLHRGNTTTGYALYLVSSVGNIEKMH